MSVNRDTEHTEERLGEPELVDGFEALLKPGQVAERLRVHPRTVTNWANRGKIRFVWTPGGHRRYPESAVIAVYEGRSGMVPRPPIG